MTKVKSKVSLAVSKLKRSHDAMTNSPGMTKSLLDDTRDETPKKKKLKSSSSTSSLVGSLLRQGNKFANLEEFAKFMSGSSGDKNNKSSKKKNKDKKNDEPNQSSLKKVQVRS